MFDNDVSIFPCRRFSGRSNVSLLHLCIKAMTLTSARGHSTTAVCGPPLRYLFEGLWIPAMEGSFVIFSDWDGFRGELGLFLCWRLLNKASVPVSDHSRAQFSPIPMRWFHFHSQVLEGSRTSRTSYDMRKVGLNHYKTLSFDLNALRLSRREKNKKIAFKRSQYSCLKLSEAVYLVEMVAHGLTFQVLSSWNPRRDWF